MEWRSMDTYPAPEERVLIAADDGSVGVGYWHPDAGWMMEVDEGEGDCEPVYWMPLPEHPRAIKRSGSTTH